MGIEIEKKFLVRPDAWRQTEKGPGRRLRQGYLSTDPNKTIRVRQDENQGFITIKGISTGASRREFEYPIPGNEAAELLELFADSVLTKTRYELRVQGKTWEVDVFHGDNEGLVVAEIELDDEQEDFAHPEWLGEEVTGDPRYYNSSLTEKPFNTWS